MPGKVNPVMAEALIMVAAQVCGHDTTIAMSGAGGHFELNTMVPVMAYDLLNSIAWLSGAARAFTDRCIAGLEVDDACCRRGVEQSLALATALAPVIGYDRAAEISDEAYRTGRTVREVALERKILPSDELDRVLDARRMTEPEDDEPEGS